MNATPEITAALDLMKSKWPDFTSTRDIRVIFGVEKPATYEYWNCDDFKHREFSTMAALIEDIRKSSKSDANKMKAAALRAQADALEKGGA